MEAIGDWKDLVFLITEDEPNNYYYLEILLKERVKRLDHAKNGKEAVDLAAINHYDMVLMDLKMPIMGGVEAVGILKKQFPDMPIIAQTAYSMLDEREIALKAGCDDYIAKPIRRDDLLEIIQKNLR